MGRALVLESIGDNGQSGQVIATLTDGETVIGREPEHGIAVDCGAISREHGRILRVRNHWFYQDLGSTNGSWINGNKVPPDEWRVLRASDYLQLADKAIRIREGEASGEAAVEASFNRGPGRSLIVFSHSNFSDEFPIPEFGRALVIGGAQCDIEIRGDVFENPGLVIERRSQNVCAYAVERQHGATVNGEELTTTLELQDRDVIRVREHLVIFNDPPLSGVGAGVGGRQDRGASEDQRIRSWSSEGAGPDLSGGQDYSDSLQDAPDPFSSAARGRKPALAGQFGSTPEEDFGHDETVAIESGHFKDSIGVPERHPTNRYSYDDTNEYSFSSTEDRITIFVGVFLLILLMVLIVWWVFLV
ncbi:MAG: FHA domain-containing protein [Bdellovibrionales bacterium]|nr:FHA domain-containing protein [Bdellovibrionales bacterium]